MSTRGSNVRTDQAVLVQPGGSAQREVSRVERQAVSGRSVRIDAYRQGMTYEARRAEEGNPPGEARTGSEDAERGL